MTFLPIVDRELRVTARRRITYWMRTAISLIAIVTGAWIFLANFGQPHRTVGPFIFIGLSVLAMVCSLLVGRFTTVDCLSEEKREGTLGLLFLTDLKGYDVVLGKLVATSMNGFFSLLAMFPVLAVTLMMGGTSSGEFWRMVLVLGNTFLFSLAIGIFASALSRDARKAITAYFLIMLFFLALVPGLGYFLVLNFPSLVSIRWPFFAAPWFDFILSFDAPYSSSAGAVPSAKSFLWSMLTIHALSWLLVLMACWITPRSWQDKPAPAGRRSWRDLWQRWSYGNATKRKNFRRRLLNKNAFYWLVARDRLKPHQVWLALGLMTVGWFCGWLGFGYYWINSMVMVASGFILNVLIKLWVLVESGQRLAEERKAGSLELLLTTPLTVREILRGQRLALQRQFLLPTIVSIVLQLFMLYNVRGRYEGPDSDSQWTAIAGIILLVADVAAIYWVSQLFALRARNPNQASVGTLMRLMILPWVLFGLMAVVANVAVEPPFKFYVVLWLVTGLFVDVAYGVAAWRQLRGRFRILAAGRVGRALPAGAR
jgi:hypothetical protein